jgi:hypothetical protein
MRYVPISKEPAARRLVNFDACGNISRTGSVRGMQTLYGWPKNGQVRLGGWIFNIGPDAVSKLRTAHILKGE